MQRLDEDRKSTVDYWDENWRRTNARDAISVEQGRDSYFYRRAHRAFKTIFTSYAPNAHNLLELGAGSSRWLPYFAQEFKFDVAGLDYSKVGCEQAREILAAARVDGVIHQGDLFEPPQELMERFDIVASFGLVEHFADTAAIFTACGKYLKPGGLIITMIPNMRGLHGALYKVFDRKVFDIHVALSLDDLSRGYRAAGLQPVVGEHLLGLPGVIDPYREEPVFVRRIIRKMVARWSAWYWRIEERGGGLRENSVTSPYLLCAALKPNR